MPWHNGGLPETVVARARRSQGTLAYGRVDTAAALARSIDTLNRLSPRPDLVVISGDIANSALPEEYEHAKTLLGALQMPFAVIPGKSRSPYTDAKGLSRSRLYGGRRDQCDARRRRIARTPPTSTAGAARHVHRAAQTVFAGVSATICPAGEQAVTLEFEPRWPEVFKISLKPSTCTRGSPARDSEVWSPIVCQSANFLAFTLMATPIRRRSSFKRLFSPAIGSLFLREPPALIFLLPGQPGYGDKWPS